MSDVKVDRVFDAVRFNEILNNPVVRADVANVQEGVLDLSNEIANERNILLMGEHGCCLFVWLMNCMYEVHTQVLPEGRGEWAKGLVRACGEWIFTKSDALEILTRVPHGHVAAKALTMYAGGRFEFTRNDCCNFRGKNVPVDIYSCRLQDWMPTAENMQEIGEQFHLQLNKEAKKIGIEEPPHEEDQNHNQYVGACIKMVMGGQIGKAITFYNRWALVSRHDPVVVVKTEPLTIKFDAGFLKVNGPNIEDVEISNAA